MENKFFPGQRVVVKAPEPWSGMLLGRVVFDGGHTSYAQHPPSKLGASGEDVANQLEVETKPGVSYFFHYGPLATQIRVFNLLSVERANEILQSMKDSSGWKDSATDEEREQINYLWTLCPGSWSFYDVVNALSKPEQVVPPNEVVPDGVRKAKEKLLKEGY